MCYRPLTITNPSFVSNDCDGFSNYVEGFSKKSLNVGCGFCPQCQLLRQKEWQLRLRYEWKSCKDSGGFCFKEELTYKPDCVPTKFGFMCFSKRDLQLFLKRLRRNMEYFCKKNGLVCPSIKYFVVCEYGGNGTHRPHYHILIFVYGNSIPVKVFNVMVRNSWQLGLTNNNTGRNAKRLWSVDSKIVSSHSGIDYVTKYLFKDKAFIRNLIQQDNGSVLVDYLSSKLSFDVRSFLDTEDVREYVKFYYVWKFLNKSIYKELLPFSLKSQGIGIGLCEHLSYADFVNGCYNDPLVSRLEVLPRYYYRKLFYDYVSLCRTYVPKKQMFDLNYNKFVNQYLTSDFIDIIKDLPSEDFNDIKSQLSFFGFSLENQTFRRWSVYSFVSSVTGKKYISPILYDNADVFLSLCKSVFERGYLHSIFHRVTFNVNTLYACVDELSQLGDIDFIDRHVLDLLNLYTSDVPFYSGQNYTIDDMFRRIDCILQKSYNYKNECICNNMLKRVKNSNLSINKQTND